MLYKFSYYTFLRKMTPFPVITELIQKFLPFPYKPIKNTNVFGPHAMTSQRSFRSAPRPSTIGGVVASLFYMSRPSFCSLLSLFGKGRQSYRLRNSCYLYASVFIFTFR